MSNPPTMPLDPNNIPGGALASLGGDQAAPINPAVPPVAPPPAPAKPFTERFFDAFNSGAGQKQTITVDPNTGAVSRTSEPGRPADWARNILSSAMAALGSPNAELPPGASGRGAAIASGYNAAKTANDQQVAQATKTAQDQSENVQKSQEMLLRQAADKRDEINSHINALKWENENWLFSQNKRDEAAKQQNLDEQSGVARMKVGNIEVPEFDTVNDAHAFANKHPEDFLGTDPNQHHELRVDPDTNKFYYVQRPANYSDRMDREVTYADGSKEVLKNATAEEVRLALTSKDAMLKDRSDILKNSGDPLYKMEQAGPEAFTGDKGPAAQGYLQTVIDNPKSDPKDVARARILKAVADGAVKAQQEFETTKTTNDANAHAAATRKASDEDIDTAAKYYVQNPNNMTALNNVSSMFGADRLRIFNKIHELAPNLDLGELQRRATAYGQFIDPNSRTQQAIQYSNNFLEHSGDLTDTVEKYRTTNVPLVNTPLNKIRNKFGDPTYTELVAAMNPVRTEYTNALANGWAPQGLDKEAAETIMNDASTPAQVEAALKVMNRTIFVQQDSRNQMYKRITGGQDYPDLITPDAKEAANKLGLGAIAAKYNTGGTLGDNKPDSTTLPKINDTKTFPNGNVGKWDGQHWVLQQKAQ